MAPSFYLLDIRPRHRDLRRVHGARADDRPRRDWPLHRGQGDPGTCRGPLLPGTLCDGRQVAAQGGKGQPLQSNTDWYVNYIFNTPLTSKKKIITGTPVGSVLCLVMSGILAEDLGWEYPFYVMGTLGVVWFALWTLLIHDGPDVNPRISDEERVYIQMNADFRRDENRSSFPPLKSIFTSVPVLALYAAKALNNWGFATLMNGIPTYLNDVQGLPLDMVCHRDKFSRPGNWN